MPDPDEVRSEITTRANEISKTVFDLLQNRLLRTSGTPTLTNTELMASYLALTKLREAIASMMPEQLLEVAIKFEAMMAQMEKFRQTENSGYLN